MVEPTPLKNDGVKVSWEDEIPYVSHMRSMVLAYLPTKLGHKNGVNVGIHIPAPWVAYGVFIIHSCVTVGKNTAIIQ